MKSEQTLSEQVADLRELKATIRERLQATEVALAEARQHSHGLQQKEQLLQQKILDLEVETATLRSQPTENFLAVLRQKELEDKNKQLLADIIKAHEDAREAAELSQRQAQSLAEQSEQIDCLNSQLEAVRAALTTLGDEKSASERRAAERCDEVRDQVLKAANVEKTNILNAHANTLRQLKYQKDEADSRAEELSCQLTALKNAEGNKVRSFSTLITGLTKLILTRTKHQVTSGLSVQTWRSGTPRKTHVLLLCKRSFATPLEPVSPKMQNSELFVRLRPYSRKKYNLRMQNSKHYPRPTQI